ncbi:urease accessory protein UreD [Klebsiella michiganensis]|uniref:Urease accessory protein UreD n=1 Tax=Klebsiella michiganensis TaxID=1134687 RepID=A0A7H4PHM7_9ENTR|nr:urease accessory protein UreD [Klebsiella michiganensis]
MHGTVLPQNKKGWQASLDLQFQFLGGKTTLASRRHVGPLTVQRPFYPEEETCHLYLLHPPGGIVGGDELTISATMDPGCHTLITMPGASKFYRSSGAQARLQQTLTLAENSTLEWLPQDAIFFPGANAALSNRLSSRRVQHAAGVGPAVPLAGRSSAKPLATARSPIAWRCGSTALRC